MNIKIFCRCSLFSSWSGWGLISTPVINGLIFREKLLNIKTCFDFLYNFRLKHFSFWEDFSEIYCIINVHMPSWPLLLSDLNKTCIFLTDLQKYSNVKFKKKKSVKCSDSQPVAQTRTFRETQKKKNVILAEKGTYVGSVRRDTNQNLWN